MNANALIRNPRHAAPRANTDAQGYTGPDSGCARVTAYLGKPSRCLDCPFLTCTGEARPYPARLPPPKRG